MMSPGFLERSVVSDAVCGIIETLKNFEMDSAYDKVYLEKARVVLARMMDFAVKENK